MRQIPYHIEMILYIDLKQLTLSTVHLFHLCFLGTWVELPTKISKSIS